MINTWMNAFGHHPDMVISEAAALAIKKSQFLPSLPEFAGYIRRAELILEARRIDKQHLREGKTWAGKEIEYFVIDEFIPLEDVEFTIKKLENGGH